MCVCVCVRAARACARACPWITWPPMHGIITQPWCHYFYYNILHTVITIVPFSLCSGLKRCSGSNDLSGMPCSSWVLGLCLGWKKPRCVHLIQMRMMTMKTMRAARTGAPIRAICRLFWMRLVNCSRPTMTRTWPTRTWNTTRVSFLVHCLSAECIMGDLHNNIFHPLISIQAYVTVFSKNKTTDQLIIPYTHLLKQSKQCITKSSNQNAFVTELYLKLFSCLC